PGLAVAHTPGSGRCSGRDSGRWRVVLRLRRGGRTPTNYRDHEQQDTQRGEHGRHDLEVQQFAACCVGELVDAVRGDGGAYVEDWHDVDPLPGDDHADGYLLVQGLIDGEAGLAVGPDVQ